MFYCYLHGLLLNHPLNSLLHSLTWALSIWGPWILIAPVARHYLERRSSLDSVPGLVSLALLAGILSFAIKIGIDIGVGLGPLTALKVYYYLPAQITIAALLMFGLRYAALRRDADNSAVAVPTLWVSNGRHEIQIETTSILAVKAARNYVEIITQEQDYLLRSSLSALAESLQDEDIVRVHRSYLVRQSAIDCVYRQSGHYWLKLINQSSVPVSKSYQEQFET